MFTNKFTNTCKSNFTPKQKKFCNDEWRGASTGDSTDGMEAVFFLTLVDDCWWIGHTQRNLVPRSLAVAETWAAKITRRVRSECLFSKYMCFQYVVWLSSAVRSVSCAGGTESSNPRIAADWPIAQPWKPIVSGRCQDTAGSAPFVRTCLGRLCTTLMPSCCPPAVLSAELYASLVLLSTS